MRRTARSRLARGERVGMRIFAPLVFVLAAAVLRIAPAAAVPISSDPRCPNVNTVAIQLQAQEATRPEGQSSDFLTIASAYQKCMQDYVKSGNLWQAFYAGTNAMSWGANAGDLLSGSDPADAQRAYALVDTVYRFMQSKGFADSQYGPQWAALDAAARGHLGLPTNVKR